MRRLIFAEKQYEKHPEQIVRLSCAVPSSWIPIIDAGWKQTRYNNRSEYIRAAILKQLGEL